MLVETNFTYPLEHDEDDSYYFSQTDARSSTCPVQTGHFNLGLRPQLLYDSSAASSFMTNDTLSTTSPGSNMIGSCRDSTISPVVLLPEGSFYAPSPDYGIPETPHQLKSSHFVSHSFSAPGDQPFVKMPDDVQGLPYHLQTPETFPDIVNESSLNVVQELENDLSVDPNATLLPSYSFGMSPTSLRVLDQVHSTSNAEGQFVCDRGTTFPLASSPAIAPGTAFGSHLLSSPIRGDGPLTPLHGLTYHSNILESSPMANMTPTPVPSQQDLLDWTDSLNVDNDCVMENRVSARGIESCKPQSRLESSGKQSSIGSRRKRTKPANGARAARRKPCTGGTDLVLVPGNPYKCSFLDCIQQRSFARQEHLKRHEKTVHSLDKPFVCRFCLTGFNRSDNLRQHYDTHAKRGGAQRNAWVAVLDKMSEHYNPDFNGLVTKDGYPVRDESSILHCHYKGCVDFFLTKKGLREHEIKKEHRFGAGHGPVLNRKRPGGLHSKR